MQRANTSILPAATIFGKHSLNIGKIRARAIRDLLGRRHVVFVGMMGCGKSAIGRLVAEELNLPFADSDAEVVVAAGMSIPEIFEKLGEDHFRSGEKRVVSRLLANGPSVLSLGGGAFVSNETREQIARHAISIWLTADADLLLSRVMRRPKSRPLLQVADPRAKIVELLEARKPIYGLANIHVESSQISKSQTCDDVLASLEQWLIANRAPASSGAEMRTLGVDLGQRSYQIHVGEGLLSGAGHRIKALRPGARVAIVTDANVGVLYGSALGHSLEAAGIAHVTITVPAGEASKSMAVFSQVVSQLLEAKLERNDLVVALGGGVIGDLAGFAASVTRRGIDFVQLPTTLLAQVDSSVGGKTGINAPQGKNLVGAFHQPVMVIADTALLKTLAPREFRAGYAEIVKYGLVDKPDFFHWLEENREEIFAFGPALANAIATSCRAKADVVAADETETGARALLNLGHTFGHALEAATNFDSTRLVHGEGVSIGMVLAHEFSNRMNLCDTETVEAVRTHLSQAGLPTDMSAIPGAMPPAGELLRYIAQDKKVKRGKLSFILTTGLGQAYIADDVAPAQVLSFLADKLGQSA